MWNCGIFLVSVLFCFPSGGLSYDFYRLNVDNGGAWGDWGEEKFCEKGTFAVGFRMKIEKYQGGGDDTALNAIELICEGVKETGNRNRITSSVGPWGDWGAEKFCEHRDGKRQFLVAFRLQVERWKEKRPLKIRLNMKMEFTEGQFETFITLGLHILHLQSEGNDDTAANYVEFQCRNYDEYHGAYVLKNDPSSGNWGQYGSWSDLCQPYRAICGMKTKVEKYQGSGDDTALNSVEFMCC